MKTASASICALHNQGEHVQLHAIRLCHSHLSKIPLCGLDYETLKNIHVDIMEYNLLQII